MLAERERLAVGGDRLARVALAHQRVRQLKVAVAKVGREAHRLAQRLHQTAPDWPSSNRARRPRSAAPGRLGGSRQTRSSRARRAVFRLPAEGARRGDWVGAAEA